LWCTPRNVQKPCFKDVSTRQLDSNQRFCLFYCGKVLGAAVGLPLLGSCIHIFYTLGALFLAFFGWESEGWWRIVFSLFSSSSSYFAILHRGKLLREQINSLERILLTGLSWKSSEPARRKKKPTRIRRHQVLPRIFCWRVFQA